MGTDYPLGQSYKMQPALRLIKGEWQLTWVPHRKMETRINGMSVTDPPPRRKTTPKPCFLSSI